MPPSFPSHLSFLLSCGLIPKYSYSGSVCNSYHCHSVVKSSILWPVTYMFLERMRNAWRRQPLLSQHWCSRVKRDGVGAGCGEPWWNLEMTRVNGRHHQVGGSYIMSQSLPNNSAPNCAAQGQAEHSWVPELATYASMFCCGIFHLHLHPLTSAPSRLLEEVFQHVVCVTCLGLSFLSTASLNAVGYFIFAVAFVKRIPLWQQFWLHSRV